MQFINYQGYNRTFLVWAIDFFKMLLTRKLFRLGIFVFSRELQENGVISVIFNILGYFVCDIFYIPTGFLNVFFGTK